MSVYAELPDGTKLEFPDGTDAAVIQRVVRGQLAGQQQGRGIGGMVGDLAAGAVRGAGSIGATLLAPIDAAARAVGVENSLIGRRDRRQAMTDALGSMGADTESFAFGAGKLGAEIAGTMGVGGAAANVAGRVLPAAMAMRAAPVREAVRTSGMTAGGAGAGVRALGGGLSGAASAALVNPDDAVTGGLVGAALPGVLQVAGKAGQSVARGVRGVANPQSRYVDILTAVAGKDNPNALMQALQGAERAALPADPLRSANLARLVAEDPLTVPQLLQDPGISQLQRTLQAGGARQFADVAAVQNRARLDALNRISPVTGTLQQAAENVGAEVARTVPAQRAVDKANVSGLFDAVDPFNESAMLLPMDQIRGAVGKYLGPGTFGTGQRAAAAVKEAANIGEVVVPATTAQRAGQAPMTLAQAVRAAGGINVNSTTARQFKGELNDLSQRVKGLTNKNGGVSLERMAEKMREAGYINSDDPAALIDDLFTNPNTVSLADADSAAARAVAKAVGDAGPQADLVLPRISNFREVQNFRSSLSEAATAAKEKGANKEFGALSAMLAAVDKRVAQIAGGKGSAEEFFAPDMVKAWKQANAAHAKYMGRYETGPQARLFRSGGDGLPAMQGAEVAGAFYGPSRSQVENVRGFQRMVDGADAPMKSLQNYAITDAAGQKDALGNLTNAQFGNWMNARSGANRELFNGADNEVMSQIADRLRSGDIGARAGMGPGSNTAQNIQAAMNLGLLDNRLIDLLANRTPIIGNFTGPVLSRMREQAKADRVNSLADLLVDPSRLYGAIGGANPAPSQASLQAQRLVKLLTAGQPVRFGDAARQGALRAAPVAVSDR